MAFGIPGAAVLKRAEGAQVFVEGEDSVRLGLVGELGLGERGRLEDPQ